MDNFEEISAFNIQDRLCGKHGCKAAWGLGNELIVTAETHAPAEERQIDICDSVNINFVTWDTQLHGSLTRKLINESHSIFLKLQSFRTDSNVTLKPQMVKYSHEYRAVIQACIEELRQTSINATDMPEERFHREMDSDDASVELQLLGLIELVWNLCELLFVDMSPGGTALLQLMEWLRVHFVKVDEWAAEATSERLPETSFQYWNAVYGYILLGRIQDARRLIGLYSQKDTETFQLIQQLLSKMPIFTVYSNHSLMEFELRWQRWHEECEQLLEQQVFANDRHAETICRILCGENEVFEELRELLGNWYSLLISRCFYTQPTIKAVDIHYHSKFAINVYGGSSVLQPFDHIILAAFEFDIHKVIKDSSFAFGSSWFPAHLCDLLFHSGQLNFDQLWSGTHIREHLLLDYACSLMCHSSLWQVAFDYLDFCEQSGRFFIEQFCDHLPLDNERKVEKILHACEKRELFEPARNICRVMGMKAFKLGRLGKALCWAVRSKDVSFISMLAEHLLLTYIEQGDLSHLALLDSLGESILLSPKLTFLGKYREFHKLYEAKEFKTAGSLLLMLLTARIAPQSFWIVLLTDALPLLQTDEIIFDSEQTYELLHCVEELTINNVLNVKRRAKQQVKDASKVDEIIMDVRNDDKIEFVRLALAKNLARAIVNEGIPTTS